MGLVVTGVLLKGHDAEVILKKQRPKNKTTSQNGISCTRHLPNQSESLLWPTETGSTSQNLNTQAGQCAYVA